MRRLVSLQIDLSLIALATLVALVLRDNLVLSQERLAALAPYLVFSVVFAAVLLQGLGMTRSVWRFASLPDFLMIIPATLLIVAGATAAGFWFNRLENVARSLPILQGLLILFALSGVRLWARLHYAWRRDMRGPHAHIAAPGSADGHETVLIVGLSRLSDLYLRSVAEYAPQRLRVAGLLGRTKRHTGRFVNRVPVLGTPEELAGVLNGLEVHGVFVDRIVVAMPLKNLSPEAQEAILDIEKRTSIRVDILSDRLGLEVVPGNDAGGADSAAGGEKTEDLAMFRIESTYLESLASRPYWRVKRALDILGAAGLSIVLSPLILVIAIVVALDAGLPMGFWQQRPGLGGRPFKLYKFRTMSPAHDKNGQRIPDDERLSVIGRLLRRTRFDELPQLFNILLGDMSFVGPRPLLPNDQPAEYRTRLLVRPGLTGWAQVHGGREVSAGDKAALDVWYVCNASFLLDLGILARTVPMVLLGERCNGTAIQRAWADLTRWGVARSCAGLAHADGMSSRESEAATPSIAA